VKRIHTLTPPFSDGEAYNTLFVRFLSRPSALIYTLFYKNQSNRPINLKDVIIKEKQKERPFLRVKITIPPFENNCKALKDFFMTFSIKIQPRGTGRYMCMSGDTPVRGKKEKDTGG
jgi:hypothetical protein